MRVLACWSAFNPIETPQWLKCVMYSIGSPQRMKFHPKEIFISKWNDWIDVLGEGQMFLAGLTVARNWNPRTRSRFSFESRSYIPALPDPTNFWGAAQSKSLILPLAFWVNPSYQNSKVRHAAAWLFRRAEEFETIVWPRNSENTIYKALEEGENRLWRFSRYSRQRGPEWFFHSNQAVQSRMSTNTQSSSTRARDT